MELRRIRYFLAVAEELHFGRAAEKLNMAQPPLSEQIRKLEDELGFKLFARTSRSVILTEAGEVFLAGARKSMEQLERASLTALQIHRGEKGHLALGFVGSICVTMLPTILQHLRKTLPELELDLHKFSSSRLIGEAVRRRELDLGIMHPTMIDDLDSRTIQRDNVMVALWNDHALANAKKLRLRDISEEDFVLFPPNQGAVVNALTHHVCKRAGFTPRVAHYVDDVYTMLGLVAARMGISLLPGSIEALKTNGITFRPLIDVNETYDMVLSWRTGTHSKLLHNTIGAVLEACAAVTT